MGWLGTAGKKEIWGRCLLGTAEKIPASELVDTTGAGDGFIGGIMYGMEVFSNSLCFLAYFRMWNKCRA